MTTENSPTPSNSTSSTPKLVEAFYTGSNDGGPKVSIAINKRSSDKAPHFTGTVGAVKVAGYIRKSANGGWIALTGERDSEGKYPQLGAANIIVNRNGNIRMSLKMASIEQTIWVSISDNVPHEMLVECGLNLEILEAKRAAASATAGK